jgi:hypothetical protein
VVRFSELIINGDDTHRFHLCIPKKLGIRLLLQIRPVNCVFRLVWKGDSVDAPYIGKRLDAPHRYSSACAPVFPLQQPASPFQCLRYFSSECCKRIR